MSAAETIEAPSPTWLATASPASVPQPVARNRDAVYGPLLVGSIVASEFAWLGTIAYVVARLVG